MKVNNRIAAAHVGLSESGMSLIRNGHRFPRMDTMEKIEAALGWSVADQVSSRGDYPSALENALREWFARAD